MELRKNQTEPVRIGIEYFKRPNPPAIIIAPTAFGKSVVITHIAQSIDKVLIIQPSQELLGQNYKKFVMMGGYATIYSASFGIKKISNVTYATIGSIYKNGAMFKELGFTKMIVDECHLYPRKSDSMIGDFLKDSGITHTLGLTATPLKLQTNLDRFGKPFSQLKMLTARSKHGMFYRDILYVAQISEMVELNYWSKLLYEQYDMDISGLVYNTSRSDYTEESMKEVYRGNDVHRKIMQKIEDTQDRKSILVFVPAVEDAKNLAQTTPNAAAVYSDMPPKEREAVIEGFRRGTIRIVYNVNILATGFDHTKVDCIILARPTASLGMYYQQIGRGTRIDPDKANCLIVDFSGNVKKFGKVENLVYKKDSIGWGLYGDGGKLLTGVPLHMIGKPAEDKSKMVMPWGKHVGKPIALIPLDYRKWVLREVKFTASTMGLKEALLATLNPQEREAIIPQMK